METFRRRKSSAMHIMWYVDVFCQIQKKTGVNGRNITNYCPSCGAKMNGIDECLTCKYAKDGEWKDNGICFACRDITWTFGTPQNIDIK